MDRRTSLAYPNGMTTSYAYDKGYRLTAMVSKTRSGVVADAWSYGYDAVGNRITKTDLTGNQETYNYDSVYRLTGANYPGGTREGFGYDAAGNRTSQLTEGGATVAYSYDAANQLQSAGSDTFTYDGNGNTLTKARPNGTTTYTYDIKNRLTAIAGPEGSETSTWGPDGSRVAMNNAALNGNVRVLYDTGGNAVLESGTLGSEYMRVYGPGTDELLGEF